MKQWVVIDFETRSALDLKKVGAWRYAQDPSTEIILCSYQTQNSTEPSRWSPDLLGHLGALDLLARDPETIFISFGDFERAIWHHIMVEDFGFPPLPNDRWHDIQAVACMRQMPRDVEKLSQVLRLPFGKDMEGRKITLSLSKPDKAGNFPELTPAIKERVGQYCDRDIIEEVAQHDALGWLPPGERKVWLLNQKVNQRGLQIDLDFVDGAQQIVEKASKPLLAEFEELTGGLRPGQRDKFMKWMSDKGIDLPDLTKQTMKELFGGSDDDDETEVGALPSVAGLELPDDVHRALTIRNLVGSSSLKKLAVMRNCVSFDGRARGLLQYHGTGPGRSAGRLLQPQNFPKPIIEGLNPEVMRAIIKDRDVEALSMFGEPLQVLVGSLRHAIVAAPGHVLMSNDYAGIQARLVLALAGQFDKLKMMAEGADVYCDMASQIFKRPINKKDHPKERGVGKNSVLGLGFQMAGKTFQLKYARDHNLEFCKNVVQVYRKEWAPKVPTVWYDLQDAATNAVWEAPKAFEAFGVVYKIEEYKGRRWLTARLPSGRKIWYFDPEPERVQAPWDQDEIVRAFSYKAMKQGRLRLIHAFGGQLAENVIMGMERDLMTAAQLKCEENGLPIVLECHDEIVCEPEEGKADLKLFDQILLDSDPWVATLHVPFQFIGVAGWIGSCYRKD